MHNSSTIGQYTLIEKIGEGEFSEVWTALHEKTQKTVAVKIVSKEKIKNPKEFTRFNREIAITKQNEHPLIVQLFQVLEDDNNKYLIMEYCSGKSFVQYIEEEGKLEESEARLYFIQFVSIIEYLHKEKNVVHRDFSTENVMFDRNKNIRLINFGLSNTFTSEKPDLKTTCGNPSYLPPEMIVEQKYSIAADIWALGVFLYYMTIGKLPFDDIKKAISIEPVFPKSLSPELTNLLKRLLTKNPDQRITIDEIKSDPWFSRRIYYFLNGELERTLPLVTPANSIISDFVLNDTVLQKMEALGYNVDVIEKRLMTRDFDEESAAYLILAKDMFTDRIRDIRDGCMKLDRKRNIPLLRTRSPSFGSTGFLIKPETRSYIAPKVITRKIVPGKRSNSIGDDTL